MDTPEAVGIRTYNPLAPGNVLPVFIMTTAAAGTLVTVYEEGVTDGFVERPNIIWIQNLATDPVYYMINGDVEVDAGVSNGAALAGGSAANDGLGSKVAFDFRRQGISKITFISATNGTRISVEKTMCA